MKRLGIASVISLSLALGACGDNPMDRGLSGAGMGAGAGVLGGLLVGAPLEGALLGAMAGGAVGALTQPNQVSFGQPLWR